MSNRLVTIATFGTTGLAHVARVQLDSQGILAFVSNEIAGETLWHVGTAVGAVNLQVFEHDAERAVAALQTDRATTAAPTGKIACPECGRPSEPGFEVCWSCGASYDGQVDRATVEEPTENAAEDGASTLAEGEVLDEQLEARVAPAWRATVIGLALCPGITHSYSQFELMRINDHFEELSASGRRRFVSASIINAVVILLAGGLMILAWYNG